MDVQYNDYEKLTISRLVNSNSTEERLLGKYIYDDTEYMAIEWDSDFTKINIHFKDEQSNKLKTWDTLCQTIYLLRKLEHNDFIGIYSVDKAGRSTSLFDHSKYIKKNGIYSIRMPIQKLNGKTFECFGYQKNISIIGTFYTDIGKDIERYAGSYVYISESLKNLVKNSFKTPEDIRHNQVKKISWWAIGVSAFLGITSLIFSTIGLYR